MKEFVSRYQTLIGFLLVCLTIILISGKGLNLAAYFSLPAYAAATDVQGSPNVAIAAFPANQQPNTGGPQQIGVMEVMADGSLKFSTGTAPGTGTTSTTTMPFPVSAPPLSCIPSGTNGYFSTCYAFGSDRVLYSISNSKLNWTPVTDNALP